jgi:hypothetical protein
MKKLTTVFLMMMSVLALHSSCQKDITPQNDLNPIDSIPQLDTGLLAHYRFTGNANDSSGNDKHGVLINGTGFTADALGRPNRAAIFDGIDDWIKVVDSTNYFAPSQMTISFQFKLRDVDNRSCFFNKTNFTTPSGVVWGIGISQDFSPRLEYVTSNPGVDCATLWGTGFATNEVEYNQDLQADRWYHAAVTFDAGTQKMYIDGRLAAENAASFISQLQCAGADLKIGAWWQNDIISIQGAMDEIRIYGRVLTLAEIKVLASEITDLTRGLIAYYPFTGNTNDSSGNNKHGIAQNGLGYATDVLNRTNCAANFDGIDDYIDILDANNYFARDVMSVSFLINLRDINTGSAFLTKSAFVTPSAVSWGVGIEYNNSANIGFTVANAPNDCSALWNTPGGSGTQIQTSTSIQNNHWYHVTLVYNEGVQNIYLNGQLEDTYTDSWGFLNQCSNANLRMGGWWQNDIISVQGKMDEVRFYDRVLSPAEISLLTAQVD